MNSSRLASLVRSSQVLSKPGYLSSRTFRSTSRLLQSQQTAESSRPPQRPPTFYQSHGRAFFKAITLAFLTYQIAYWGWLTIETEEIQDQKNREIKSLEGEVRLLEESRKTHRPGG